MLLEKSPNEPHSIITRSKLGCLDLFFLRSHIGNSVVAVVFNSLRYVRREGFYSITVFDEC